MGRRNIEIFSAGCPICEDIIAQVRKEACPSCSVTVHDMHDEKVAMRARSLGVKFVPAVVIDGVLADCCAGRGVDMESLKRLGLGKPETRAREHDEPP